LMQLDLFSTNTTFSSVVISALNGDAMIVVPGDKEGRRKNSNGKGQWVLRNKFVGNCRFQLFWFDRDFFNYLYKFTCSCWTWMTGLHYFWRQAEHQFFLVSTNLVAAKFYGVRIRPYRIFSWLVIGWCPSIPSWREILTPM
jgi:hypothetical protein